MGLFEFIAAVEDEKKTLTVFNPEAGVTATLREHFADRNLDIRETEHAAGPRNYAVLSHDDDFLTAIDVSDVLAVDRGVEPDFTRETYDPVLDALDETLFTSYDTDRMVAASKEIEDRAWRGASGQLHAGFQTYSRFASQADVYDHLAERGDLDVHVYAHPDEDDIDAPAGPALYLSTATEVHDTWFVAYDGGGVEETKCALLAEERQPGSFYGFWTYDSDTVDSVTAYLRRTYATTAADGTRADGG
jgi:hypothetical protein